MLPLEHGNSILTTEERVHAITATGIHVADRKPVGLTALAAQSLRLIEARKERPAWYQRLSREVTRGQSVKDVAIQRLADSWRKYSTRYPSALPFKRNKSQQAKPKLLNARRNANKGEMLGQCESFAYETESILALYGEQGVVREGSCCLCVFLRCNC